MNRAATLLASMHARALHAQDSSLFNAGHIGTRIRENRRRVQEFKVFRSD